MSLLFYIDFNLIPDSDIIEYPLQEESIEFNQDQLIAAEADIVLGNDENDYSPFSIQSIFYHSDWYNKTVEIYDDYNNVYVFKGRIKDIEVDDSKKTTTIKATNYVRDLSDTILNYTNTSAITVAELIKNIIIDHVELDDEFVNDGSFQNIINVHDENSIYADLNYSIEDNITCLSVIEELCRITTCNLYTIDNIIYLYSWEEYSGEIGTRIQSKDLSPGSFRSNFEDNVINDYNIAYKNGALVAYKPTDYPTSLISSINKYGTRTFNVPDQNIESTASSDFKILLQSANAAGWCGNRRIDKFYDLTQKFNIKVDGDFEFLRLNDQLDLDFGDLNREPVKITVMKPDRSNKTFDISGYFLNLPTNVYTRDEEPPISPELFSVLPGHKSILLKWTENQETDLAGYYLYFAVTMGMWFQEICNLGSSPVESKNPNITNDGYCYLWLRQMSISEYNCRVSAFDTSYNEGTPSNILAMNPFIPDDTYENLYMLQGDPYIDGLTYDLTNAKSGTVPDGYTTYSEVVPGVPITKVISACYESGIIYKTKGIDSILLKGMDAPAGNLRFSYRTSSDNTTWSSWTSEMNIVSLTEFTLPGYKYFQYRILFYSPLWSDPIKAYVYKII